MPRVVVAVPSFGIASIKAEKVDAIIANRVDVYGREQYLVRWQDHEATDKRLLSWHTLHELRQALFKVQQYLEQRNPSRKRKAGDVFNHGGHERRESPSDRRLLNEDRSPSVYSNSSAGSRSVSDEYVDTLRSYNGEVVRVDDEIVIRASEDGAFDTTNIPTPDMVAVSASSPVRQGHYSVRAEFKRRLERAPGAPVSFVNVYDETTPSLNFTFIDDYVLGQGVQRVDPAALVGCSKCRPDMGQGIGCEYTRKCGCLEFAEVDPVRLNDEQRALYEQDPTDDSLGLPKRFPYGSGSRNRGLLVSFYLDKRAPIYECNELCACGPWCKNRCVQHGRQVKIEIFRTKDRGFGLRTKERLLRGQFVDTYRGEVITWAEADRRSEAAGGGLDSYQYALDKFIDADLADLPPDEHPYVVDGETMGGPTRFINHSCDPNCRQYTVSYNKFDRRVYELAFFACQDIEVDEELTFDYLDKDDDDDDDDVGDNGNTDDEARGVPPASQQLDTGKERIECRCGASNCRKWLWM